MHIGVHGARKSQTNRKVIKSEQAEKRLKNRSRLHLNYLLRWEKQDRKDREAVADGRQQQESRLAEDEASNLLVEESQLQVPRGASSETKIGTRKWCPYFL